MKKLLKLISILCLSFAGLISCGNAEKKSKAIAVFVPGIMADSPIYAKLADGVTSACEEYSAAHPEKALKPYIFEAGTNQAKWSEQLTSLVATGKYDVIISSNPSLPDLAKPLTQQFPSQKFIFLDATCKDNQNIATACYKQDEAAYLTGYIAALMSKSKKIGLLAAQEYPVMNNIILPNYEKGAKAAVEGASVDFRIVGNWWDAKKGAELADAMSLSGVDVILPICGGAAQGVVASAKEHQFYLCWFDSNTYSSAPGLVISCAVNLQEKLSKEMTLEYLEGNTKWGTAVALGMKEGYIKFVDDDPLYESTVPENVRNEVSLQIKNILGK